jgi:hypothetical protein
LSAARAFGQVVLPSLTPEPRRELVLPRNLFWEGDPSFPGDVPSERVPRLYLFHMQTGYLNSPVGVEDDDSQANDPDSGLAPGTTWDDRLQVALGNYNPFFDFRRRGDPGDVGYYKLHMQYQVFDNPAGGLCLGLHALTPAGLEADGLARGPTVLTPALAWYTELGNESAFHAFVGKDLHANPAWIEHLERSFQYGVAFQSLLPGLQPGQGTSVHLFMEALGRQAGNGDLGARPSTWEFLPGLQWQCGQRWWLSGGLILPVEGHPRLDPDFWQITFSSRF